jgi:hypothetical protein
VGDEWRFVEKILHGDYIADISKHYPPAAAATNP